MDEWMDGLGVGLFQDLPSTSGSRKNWNDSESGTYHVNITDVSEDVRRP